MLIHLGLLSACFLWAISFIASKVALQSAPPLTVVTLRLALSALCFVAWFTVRGWPRFDRRQFRQMFLLSLFGTGLHYGTQTVGLQWTAASNASLYAAACPVSIAVIAAVFLGERLTGRKLFGIFLATAGALTAMGLSTLLSIEFRGRFGGDMLVLASIFLWAAFTVYGKRLSPELGAMELLGVVTIIGAVTMLPVGAAEMRLSGAELSSITFRSWVAIAFLGLTCSFLATLLYFLALERMESGRVGVYLYTIPLMTYLVAWLYLGEHIGWNLAAASGLVLSGVYLTERG
jgi:drug/metabolite transporter (DMT)-like permease